MNINNVNIQPIKLPENKEEEDKKEPLAIPDSIRTVLHPQNPEPLTNLKDRHVVKKEKVIDLFPSEAVFSLKDSIFITVNEALTAWNPNRKIGDYFVTPSSSNSDKCYLYVCQSSRNFCLTIRKDKNNQFIVIDPSSQGHSFDGSFSDLQEKIKSLGFVLTCAVVPKPNLIAAFPKEALFQPETSNQSKIERMHQNWCLSQRKNGDYYLLCPRNRLANEWRLAIYFSNYTYVFTIQKDNQDNFELVHSKFPTQKLNGQWSDLEEKMKALNMPLTSPAIPQAQANPQKNQIIKDFPEEGIFFCADLEMSVIDHCHNQWRWSSKRKTGDYYLRCQKQEEWSLFHYTKTKDSYEIGIFKIKDGSKLIPFNSHISYQSLNFRDFDHLQSILAGTFCCPLLSPTSPNRICSDPLYPREEQPLMTEPQFAEKELDQELEEDIPGRSVEAHGFLWTVQGFDGSDLKYQGVSYQPVKSSLLQFYKNQRNVISVGGGSTRELITINYNHSPLLSHHYDGLVQKLNELKMSLKTSSLAMEQCLPIIMDYVRKNVFPSTGQKNLTNSFNDLVAEYKASHPQEKVTTHQGISIPVIPLEFFIEKGIGVCRHHALATVYMLDRLAEEHGGSLIPKGLPQHIRDNLVDQDENVTGAHSWLCFIEENGKVWHIDTLWNKWANFSNAQEKDKLMKSYGKKAMKNQEKKTAFALTKLLNPGF